MLRMFLADDMIFCDKRKKKNCEKKINFSIQNLFLFFLFRRSVPALTRTSSMVKLTIFELHSKHRKTHASANTAQRAKAKTHKKKAKKKSTWHFFFPSFFAIVDTPRTRGHKATQCARYAGRNQKNSYK
jgi:hypothetical protein